MKFVTRTLLLGLALFLIPLSAAQAAAPVKVRAKAITSPLSNKTAASTVTVSNVSKRRMAGLTLTAQPARGMRVNLSGARKARPTTRRLKTLRAGARTRVGIRLRRTGSKAPRSGSMRLVVRRNGKTVGRGTLRFGRAPAAPTPPPAAPAPPPAAPAPPPPPAETLTGRFFWGSKYTPNRNLMYSLYFTGPDFVWVGDLIGAYPTCTGASDQCKPYTFDPATRALTIDGRPAALEGNKITFDGQAHVELGVPKPGARWDIVLTYVNTRGTCVGWTDFGCRSVREDLVFRPDGTFDRGVFQSIPDDGTVIVPPDSTGTYEVRADKTLRLAFADGTERIVTLGIHPAEDGSYPENPTAGAVMNSQGYFDLRK